MHVPIGSANSWIIEWEEFILPDWSPPDDPAEGRLWPSDDDDDDEDDDDDDQMIATFLFLLIGAGWYPGCYAMGSLPRLVVYLKPFSTSIYFQGLSQLCFCLPPWQRSHCPSSLSSSPPLPTSLEFARLKKIPQQCLESGLEEWRQCSFSLLLWSWHTPPSQFLFHWKYLHKPCQNGSHQFLKAYQASLEYLMEKCVIQNPKKERKSDQNIIQNHPKKMEKWSKWET